VRSCTKIRVPNVLAWSCDPKNAVGTEYIIMEKVPGVALAEEWEAMGTMGRYKIIDQIVEIERELGSLEFPAYGSIFLQDSAPCDELRRCPLPAALDPAGLFCIGPSCTRSLWREGSRISDPMAYAGPCKL
jgi:hypothetical protein